MVESPVTVHNIPDSGDFGEVPFARILWVLSRDSRSGTLDIRDRSPREGGKILKRVIVGEGSSFAVQGGSVAETLGEILLGQNKLTKEQCEELKTEARGDYSQMEQKILSGAVIAGNEIPELMTWQVSLKIKNLFPLVRGHFDFKTQPLSALQAKHVLMPLAVEKLVLESVMEHYPLSRIKKEFSGLDKKVFSLAPAGVERLGRLGLDPAQQRWLRGVPESFNQASFLKGAPVREDKALPLLATLYFLEIAVLPSGEDNFLMGQAYLDPKEVKAAAAAVKAAEKKLEPAGSKPATKGEATVGTEVKAPVKPVEESKLPVEEMLDGDLSDPAILKEIDRLLGVIARFKKKECTYFDLMGVEENTPSPKIKKIYFKFAKKFHPDARPDLFRGEIKEKVEDLFAKITEAYNTLGDDHARSEYVKTLKSSVSDKEMEEAHRALEAEVEFQKAEVLLKRGSWHEAEEKLERAIGLYADEPEYKMYLAWVRYKIKGQSEAINAKRIIKEVLEKRPTASDGLFFLGMIEKNEGNLDAAEQHLTKFIAKKPHDIEAKRELQIIARKRSAPAPKKKGGLFGKK